MKIASNILDIFKFLLFTLIFFSSKSWAILGESWDSSQKFYDQTIKFSRNYFFTNGYTLYSYESVSGLLISEYVNSDGVVFAIKWSGSHLPSMDKLISSKYRSIFSDVGLKFNNKSISINQDGFLFVSSGRMRGFNGYVYDIHLAPVNFNLINLQ